MLLQSWAQDPVTKIEPPLTHPHPTRHNKARPPIRQTKDSLKGESETERERERQKMRERETERGRRERERGREGERQRERELVNRMLLLDWPSVL